MNGKVTTAARRFYDSILAPCLRALGKSIDIIVVRVKVWMVVLTFIVLVILVWRWGPECFHIVVEHLVAAFKPLLKKASL